MCECSKCKEKFEEINLTWVETDGNLILVCEDCKDNADVAE